MDERTKSRVLFLLKELMSHPITDPFIGEFYVDEYHEEIYAKKVKKEVDLEMIYNQVAENRLSSVAEVAESVELIWANMYATHEPGNFMRTAAEESEKLYRKIFRNLFLSADANKWYNRVEQLSAQLCARNSEIPDSDAFCPKGIDAHRSISEQIPTNAKIQKLLKNMKSMASPDDHRDLIKLISESQPELSLESDFELSIFALNPDTFQKVYDFVDERIKDNKL